MSLSRIFMKFRSIFIDIYIGDKVGRAKMTGKAENRSK